MLEWFFTKLSSAALSRIVAELYTPIWVFGRFQRLTYFDELQFVWGRTQLQDIFYFKDSLVDSSRFYHDPEVNLVHELKQEERIKSDI